MVSCNNNPGGLFLLDTDINKASLIDSRIPSTGLTWWDEGIFVHAQGKHLKFRDTQGTFIKQEGFPSVDQSGVHDIVMDGDLLYAVNTSHNLIQVHDRNLKIIKVLDACPGGGTDSCHINSVLVKNGKVYGSAFGMHGWKEEWKNKKMTASGALYTFEGDKVKVLYEGMKQPHTVRELHGKVVVCNSVDGEVLFFNGEWKPEKRFKVGNGYVRGLAQHGKGYFVGLSANRQPGIYGYPEVGDYDITCAHVAYVEEDKVMSMWPIGGAKEVYDILVMP